MTNPITGHPPPSRARLDEHRPNPVTEAVTAAAARRFSPFSAPAQRDPASPSKEPPPKRAKSGPFSLSLVIPREAPPTFHITRHHVMQYLTSSGYSLEATLGAGAGGAVYLATDPHGQRVALKIFTPKADNVKYFQYNSERGDHLIANIDEHPNVLRPSKIIYFDSTTTSCTEEPQTDRQIAALVMPTEPRLTSLTTDNITPEMQTLPNALSIFRQMADGLQHLHSNHVMHRDLKPDNILITPEMRVRIIDFGLARMARAPASSPVNQSLFAAPERILGEGVDLNYHFPSDVWALGLVMRYFLTKEHPFTDLWQIQGFEHSTLPALPPQYECLNSLISSMLNPNPTLRPTAQQVQEQLTTLLGALHASAASASTPASS